MENNNRQPEELDAIMVYINPEVMQSLADLSARKQAGFQELLDAAAGGDLEAAYQLGLDYYTGSDGAPEDDEKAFAWFAKAAEQGHHRAEFYLGECCENGYGVAKNLQRAVELYTLSHQGGYPDGTYALGKCF